MKKEPAKKMRLVKFWYTLHSDDAPPKTYGPYGPGETKELVKSQPKPKRRKSA